MKKIVFILFFIITFINITFAENIFSNSGIDKKQALNITADKVEILRDKNKIIFTNNVKATQDVFQLSADKMEVFYKESNDNKMSIENISAKNNVKFNTDKIFANGDEGYYNVNTKKIRLVKNVTATEAGMSVFAQEFEYDIATKKTNILGNKSNKERVTIILNDLESVSPKGNTK